AAGAQGPRGRALLREDLRRGGAGLARVVIGVGERRRVVARAAAAAIPGRAAVAHRLLRRVVRAARDDDRGKYERRYDPAHGERNVVESQESQVSGNVSKPP